VMFPHSAKPHGPPEPGWQRIIMDDPFAAAAGPWFWQMQDTFLLGMHVEARHVSIRGVCHGAVLMTMADMMSLPAGYMGGLTDRLVPTMTFAMDFIAPAREGDWLVMRTELLKRTRKTLFTQAIIRAGGEVVARSNAIFRILSEPDPSGPILNRILGLEPPA